MHVSEHDLIEMEKRALRLQDLGFCELRTFDPDTNRLDVQMKVVQGVLRLVIIVRANAQI